MLRGKLVVILAIVVTIAAGAIGGGVADKLSSFGADDPAAAVEGLREAAAAALEGTTRRA